APEGGWTGRAMLATAGVLYAAVYSQGTQGHQLAGITADMVKKMPKERQEAVEETFHRDIHDGIGFVSHITFGVIDGNYDQKFGPEVRALVYENEDGGKTVIPARGFKGHEDIA